MRGHNICFHREIRKIIFELSSIPIICSSEGYPDSLLMLTGMHPEHPGTPVGAVSYASDVGQPASFNFD